MCLAADLPVGCGTPVLIEQVWEGRSSRAVDPYHNVIPLAGADVTTIHAIPEGDQVVRHAVRSVIEEIGAATFNDGSTKSSGIS